MGEPSILVAGEALIDFIPGRSGPLAGVEAFERRAGGAPANVAVGLARLGHAPWFLTRVGSDPFGDFLAETLAENGVLDRFIERDPDASTALAFVVHGEDGGPEFTFYRDGAADNRIDSGAVPDSALSAVEWVYAGGVSLSAEPARSATFELVKRARVAGASIAFDPNARPELWGEFDFASSVGRMLERVDVLAASSDDLRAAGFEAEDPEAAAESIVERGPHTALVTLGDAGSLAYATGAAPWGAGSVTHAGYAIDAVDTTGAGDAFVAGALAAIAEGERSLSEVLAFANAVAAITTTDSGAMTALPDLDSVREFRESR